MSKKYSAEASKTIKVQQLVTLIAVLLFVVKMYAWYETRSVSILTDALESIVNVVAAFIGLYSVYLSAKPQDKNHPYGHGKIEFLTSGIEGTLIIIAGIFTIYEAVLGLRENKPVEKLGLGIVIISIGAVINYSFGVLCIKTGKKNKSLALISSGTHLKADTYTTLGIIVGLLLVIITKNEKIDKYVAIIVSIYIIYSGYTIIRSAIAGIMDEADTSLLSEMITYLNDKRKINWVDFHKMRIIKYGPTLRVDAHVTLPWYFEVRTAHDEIDTLQNLLEQQYSNSIQVNIHSDACSEDISCPICIKDNCSHRKHPFERKINWTLHNAVDDAKHNKYTRE